MGGPFSPLCQVPVISAKFCLVPRPPYFATVDPFFSDTLPKWIISEGKSRPGTQTRLSREFEMGGGGVYSNRGKDFSYLLLFWYFEPHPSALRRCFVLIHKVHFPAKSLIIPHNWNSMVLRVTIVAEDVELHKSSQILVKKEISWHFYCEQPARLRQRLRITSLIRNALALVDFICQ